jgi:hypothetical protein
MSEDIGTNDVIAVDRMHAVAVVLHHWPAADLVMAEQWACGQRDMPERLTADEAAMLAHTASEARFFRRAIVATFGAVDDRELALRRTQRELARMRENYRKIDLCYRRAQTIARVGQTHLARIGAPEGKASADRIGALLANLEQDEPLETAPL